jgi:HAD superfamily hydrolase (TIGR01509 family)
MLKDSVLKDKMLKDPVLKDQMLKDPAIKIPLSKKSVLKAVLFDMDGTLTDTDHIHMLAWQEVLASHGVVIDKAIYDTRVTGRVNPQIVHDFLPLLDDDAVLNVVRSKEAIFCRMATKLEPLAGVREILNWCKAQKLMLALVTNATNDTVPFVLEALGLTETFKVRVLAEDVPAGKPDPIHYQSALERLGVDASQAIAFEDSPSGMRSAAGAGIYVVGLTTSQSDEVLRKAGASLTIPDFASSELWSLLESYEP